MEEDRLCEFRNIVEESRIEDNRAYYIKLRDTLDFIENLLTRYKQMEAELEKKEAIINEMSIYINSPLRIPEEKYCEFYNSDDDCCWKTDKECKDCIKEYFTKKVEGK